MAKNLFTTKYTEQNVMNLAFEEAERAIAVTGPNGSDGVGNIPTTMGTGLLYSNDSVVAHPAACEVTEVDLATDADVVVTANPAKLLGIYVSVAMSAHVAPIKDNTTAKITLPASLAAGTYIPCNAATFSTNITVESDNAATGKILVFWLPLA